MWVKILVGDNLMRTGFSFVYWYCMCHCIEEIVNHLMIHCEKAYQLWCFVFRSFGVSWFLQRTVIEPLFEWRNWLEKYSSNIWNLPLLCMM